MTGNQTAVKATGKTGDKQQHSGPDDADSLFSPSNYSSARVVAIQDNPWVSLQQDIAFVPAEAKLNPSLRTGPTNIVRKVQARRGTEPSNISNKSPKPQGSNDKNEQVLLSPERRQLRTSTEEGGLQSPVVPDKSLAFRDVRKECRHAFIQRMKDMTTLSSDSGNKLDQPHTHPLSDQSDWASGFVNNRSQSYFLLDQRNADVYIDRKLFVGSRSWGPSYRLPKEVSGKLRHNLKYERNTGFLPNAFDWRLQVKMRTIQKKIGYWFKDRELLREALSYFVMEDAERILGCWSNKRLAFLGDKVLSLPVYEAWYFSGDRGGR